MDRINTHKELKQSNQLGHLSAAEAKRLRDCQARLKALLSSPNQKYARARLGQWCGLVQRRPGNVVPFTAAENDIICKLSYQEWDCLLHLLMAGSEEDLKSFVVEPAGLIANRQDITILLRCKGAFWNVRLQTCACIKTY